MIPTLCLHCEREPQSQRPRLRCLRLCDRCGAFRGLRRVYRLPHGWTPAWDAHLQRLVERAKLGLPVGIEDPAYVIPNPPDKRARKKLRPRRPRLYKFSLRSRAPHD